MTIEEFKAIPFGSVFAQGKCTDDVNGANMTGSGRMLRWVAKKGRINDWCIYCHWATSSFEYIITNGDKVTGESNIKRLVPCDDDMFNAYRY